MWKWINQHVTGVGQKKSESPTGFEPMISQNTGRTLYPLQLRRIHGERGHILKLSINSNIDPQNKRSGETGGQGTLLSTIFQALSPSLKFRQHSLSGRSNSVFYEVSLRRRKKPFLGIPIYLTFNSITCSSKGFAEFLTSQPSQFTLNSLTLVWTHGNKTKQNKQPNKKLDNKTKQNKTKKQTTTEKPKKKKYPTHHFVVVWKDLSEKYHNSFSNRRLGYCIM